MEWMLDKVPHERTDGARTDDDSGEGICNSTGSFCLPPPAPGDGPARRNGGKGLVPPFVLCCAAALTDLWRERREPGHPHDNRIRLEKIRRLSPLLSLCIRCRLILLWSHDFQIRLAGRTTHQPPPPTHWLAGLLMQRSEPFVSNFPSLRIARSNRETSKSRRKSRRRRRKW